MGRLPLILLSTGGAVVVFAATTAAILAAQGRLGEVVHGPESAPASQPAFPPIEIATSAPAPGEGGVAPPRRATASLAAHFSLPSPFRAEELEKLMDGLKEERARYEKLRTEAAGEKEANERDRLDLDARTKELEGLRTRLEAERAKIETQVAEWMRRNQALEAGEERFVKATAARLETLDVNDAQVQLLDLDERLAGQVLARLAPRKSGKLLAALPPDKRISLTKALQVANAADPKQTPPQEGR
ncbi:MAG TPA: hypothetical protein VKE69_06870 [Planctomycetota bacterium]|nr:hypothetical protein [Planctomycetota bacterium]